MCHLLTGLKNRRAADKEIPAYIKRYNISFEPFALAILDIDHFKKINDTYGHQVGDSVLESFSEVLTNDLRPNDRIYRWGGEEFLIALPETSLSEATTICQRLASNVRQISIEEVNNVTVSIGLTRIIEHDDYDAMLQRADGTLYQAKNGGRNQVVTG